MVAKVLGLASGALVASVAVWAFNDWRHVSDEDRIVAILEDHCIPYINDGIEPFTDTGRPVGVYDNVNIVVGFTQAKTMLLFDDRFVANWGDVEGSNLRACRVEGRPIGGQAHAFVVDPDGFQDRMTKVVQPLGDLRSMSLDWDGSADFVALGWLARENHATEPQVVMTVGETSVIKVLVTQVIPDQS